MKMLAMGVLVGLISFNVVAGELIDVPEFDLNFSCKTKDIQNMFLNLVKTTEDGNSKLIVSGNHLYGTGYLYRTKKKPDEDFISIGTPLTKKRGLYGAHLSAKRLGDILILAGTLKYKLGFCPDFSFCYDYEDLDITCLEIK